MLDACIERKHGFEKTLAVRMPKRFLQNVNASNDRITQGCSVIKSEIWDGDPEIISFLEADKAENIETTDVKVFEVDYEECCEDEEDVPRISIPDEGSADGTLCKVSLY